MDNVPNKGTVSVSLLIGPESRYGLRVTTINKRYCPIKEGCFS